MAELHQGYWQIKFIDCIHETPTAYAIHSSIHTYIQSLCFHSKAQQFQLTMLIALRTHIHVKFCVTEIEHHRSCRMQTAYSIFWPLINLMCIRNHGNLNLLASQAQRVCVFFLFHLGMGIKAQFKAIRLTSFELASSDDCVPNVTLLVRIV